jgi:hypothetical protein
MSTGTPRRPVRRRRQRRARMLAAVGLGVATLASAGPALGWPMCAC